jgi:ABC-type phosphate/phosphonate transport system substrate-binding protein
MPSTVSLPMYDEKPAALQAFWRGLKDHMIEAGLRNLPDALSEPWDLHSHWLDPGLLLSQTCGYPLVRSLAGKVQLVGIPRYSAPGFEGTSYSSRVVVRADDMSGSISDLKGRRAAFNSPDSQSGYNALRALVAPYAARGRFFGEVIETGGHLSSLQFVQSRQADVAAIDCVTYAHAADAGLVEGLRTLCYTEKAPGLPLITSLETSPDDLIRLQSAFAAASVDPKLAHCRRALRLEGFEIVELDVYHVCEHMEMQAAEGRYPVLA